MRFKGRAAGGRSALVGGAARGSGAFQGHLRPPPLIRYTSRLMAFAYDRYMPPGMTWRDLFDMVIVMARKPVRPACREAGSGRAGIGAERFAAALGRPSAAALKPTLSIAPPSSLRTSSPTP